MLASMMLLIPSVSFKKSLVHFALVVSGPGRSVGTAVRGVQAQLPQGVWGLRTLTGMNTPTCTGPPGKSPQSFSLEFLNALIHLS